MSPRPTTEESPLRAIARTLLAAGSLVTAAAIVHVTGINDLLHKTWIDQHVIGRGTTGLLVFVAATALVTALGCPRQVPSFLAGYAFGALKGSALALTGTIAGAAITFAYGRFVGRKALPRSLGPRLSRIDDFLCTAPFQSALIVRLMPIGSNVLTNLLAGTTRVNALRFLAGSAIGFIPQTLIFALMGKGFRVDPVWRIGLAALLFLGSAWIGHRLYRRYRRYRRRRATDVETAVSGPVDGVETQAWAESRNS